MNQVRVGIVGLGMGGLHARHLVEGKVPRGVLAAVCDLKPDRLAKFPDARHFSSHQEMIRSGAIDAVLVATPHYAHPDIAIDALRQGLHVMVEKPVAVHKIEVERLLAAAAPGGPLLAVMLNQRTDPRYRKMREIIQSGQLGALQRVTWIITDWFRTQKYFASSDWRGTWAGEGGGLLMNQCPHQLDLLQWLAGMPASVRAWCSLGKHHAIEVEDEVTAYLQYPGGATGLFVACTAEAPGTNRLEIAGDLGRLTLEGSRLEWTRNAVSAREFLRTSEALFDAPPSTTETFVIEERGGQHAAIMQNFVEAILDGAPLIAPGRDGLPSVELANAMLLSSERGNTVPVPIDGQEMAETLQKLVSRAQAARGEAKTR